MSTSTNIYGQTRQSTWQRFEHALSGSSDAVILVASTRALSSQGAKALAKSFEARGYPEAAVAYARLEGLEPEDVFALVEGLDPLCLVATDQDAARAYARACRHEFPLEQATRVFGREARAFESLDELLADEAGKQRAWRLLKSIPENRAS